MRKLNVLRTLGVGRGAQPLSDAGPKPKTKGNKCQKKFT